VAWKIIVGLVSHWPCITDFSGLSSYMLMACASRGVRQTLLYACNGYQISRISQDGLKFLIFGLSIYLLLKFCFIVVRQISEYCIVCVYHFFLGDVQYSCRHAALTSF